MPGKFEAGYMWSAIGGKTDILQRAGFYITDVTAYGSGSKKFIAFVIVSQSTSAQAKVTPKVGVDIVNI